MSRFIPAPAGNICRHRQPPGRLPVHPRACGEHLGAVSNGRPYSGSSPRLRGTYLPERERGQDIRFIPAPAGNIDFLACYAGKVSVHPRACGEHSQSVSEPVIHCGSSPRLRGTCLRRGFPGRLFRFIPAPAGNISRGQNVICLPTVHPRACGEHPISHQRRLLLHGSSPRLRGTSLIALTGMTGTRFIPAPAGNIPPDYPRSKTHPVHPRACGEHARPHRGAWALCGSSPRLRGTLAATARSSTPTRFIPAPAGNMAPEFPAPEFLPVHPRACGEHFKFIKIG